MRLLVVLLVLLGAAAGGWWLLRPPAHETPLEGWAPQDPSGAPGPVRALPAQAPVLAEASPPVAAARIGVAMPGEAILPPDPDIPPWDACMVRLAREPGQRVTGAALLDALATRLYVRVRRAADLEALRALRLEADEAELPLAHVVNLLQLQGWRATVMDPRVLLYRSDEVERAPLPESPR